MTTFMEKLSMVDEYLKMKNEHEKDPKFYFFKSFFLQTILYCISFSYP